MGDQADSRFAGEQAEVAREPQTATSPELPIKRKNLTKPTIEQFEAWLKEEHPNHIGHGIEFYRTMQSQDWINGYGKPVLNVKSTFNSLVRGGWIDKYKPRTIARTPLAPISLPESNPFLEAISK